MKLSAATGFLCLSLIAASVAPAAALTVTETTDFSDDVDNSSPVGTLEIGLNTIRGSISSTCTAMVSSAACSDYSRDWSDSVSFLVPDDAFLTTAIATISKLTVDGSGYPGLQGYSSTGLPFLLGKSSNGTFDISPYTPLTRPQSYTFSPILYMGDVGDTISFDWSLGLTVEKAQVVPLPATLPLLLGALGLAFAATRRRRGHA